MPWHLPRVVLVLGKGGVGRSTVSAALALELARRGERTLVFGWTHVDPFGPWFSKPPAGLVPAEVLPRVHVANYRLDDTLELYFAWHLKLPRFYKHVIRGEHLRRLIEAAPGIAEVFFVGHLWWLSTLASTEAGLQFDRIVVDAPATGHGASLLDVPSVLASLRAPGLVGLEATRVTSMLGDPDWLGAVVVAQPEELAAEETVELIPRITQRLGRPPLALLINRSVSGTMTAQAHPPWLGALGQHVTPSSLEALGTAHAALTGRIRYEGALRRLLDGKTVYGTVLLSEQLLRDGPHTPADTARRLSAELAVRMRQP